jgi:hypothetical protein
MKAPLRSRSIGTKVTEEEYARLEARAGECKQSLSEWSREALLDHAAEESASAGEQTVLAEVLALRTILLNLFFQLAKGGPVAVEEMKSIIERADTGKLEKALARLQDSRTGPAEKAAAAGGVQ